MSEALRVVDARSLEMVRANEAFLSGEVMRLQSLLLAAVDLHEMDEAEICSLKQVVTVACVERDMLSSACRSLLDAVDVADGPELFADALAEFDLQVRELLTEMEANGG